MGDLISRKELIDCLEDEHSQYEMIINIPEDAKTKDIIDITLTSYRKLLFQAIRNQPTAYDVDAVLEQLDDAYNNGTLGDYHNIVKGAVKE